MLVTRENNLIFCSREGPSAGGGRVENKNAPEKM